MARPARAALRRFGLTVLATVSIALGVLPAPAAATSPGPNGEIRIILFNNTAAGRLLALDPDGSNVRSVPGPAPETRVDSFGSSSDGRTLVTHGFRPGPPFSSAIQRYRDGVPAGSLTPDGCFGGVGILPPEDVVVLAREESGQCEPFTASPVGDALVPQPLASPGHPKQRGTTLRLPRKLARKQTIKVVIVAVDAAGKPGKARVATLRAR